jgi:hypothetical protein
VPIDAREKKSAVSYEGTTEKDPTSSKPAKMGTRASALVVRERHVRAGTVGCKRLKVQLALLHAHYDHPLVVRYLAPLFLSETKRKRNVLFLVRSFVFGSSVVSGQYRSFRKGFHSERLGYTSFIGQLAL